MVRRWTRWYHWIAYVVLARSIGVVVTVAFARWAYSSQVKRDFVTICTVSGLPDVMYARSTCRCVWDELREEYSVPYLEYWIEGRQWAQISYDDLQAAALACW